MHILAIFFAFFGRDRSKSSCSCSCQSGKLSSDHILYCHDFILSTLQLEWAKSYRVVLCQSITKCSQCLVSQLST